MPRPVAVILGVALAALSIGFNTARYPVVWEMAGRTGTSHQQPASADMDASPHEVITQTKPPGQPLNAEPPKPIAVAASLKAEGLAHDDERAETVEQAEHPARPAEPQKALVPVVPVALSSASSGTLAAGSLRRLPPVMPGYSGPAGFDAGMGSTIPIYPTTGLE